MGLQHGHQRQVFAEAVEEALPDIDTRVRWVLDNPDIVAFVHALRVENAQLKARLQALSSSSTRSSSSS